ncbi:baculoviral IAP repeat-containing protein 5 [Ceratina calcarata]|uniref:Baculoviral IAP repeat-containing protein 5 n=1 Tax=Ceratina calcarata TaxID=156304 RepID=A0AAJ7WDN7_9HYME|nr:baculoviral IAP repeat-containing protein 5 [Ceratina calcarata]
MMEILPEPDSMFWKTARLKTFDNWPFRSSDNCNAELMAAAGFFAVGGREEPDLVQCFICAKQLDGWDAEDDPWTEHARHQSDCSFVMLGKSDESLWTVNDLFDLLKKFIVKECTHELDQSMAVAKRESEELMRKIPQIYMELRKGRKD